jgi:hypothetical protein
MPSNLPPGVTESMIPGNRPEDQEVEITMIFSVGEIDALRSYNDAQHKIEIPHRHELWDIVSNMIDQFDDEDVEYE